MRLLDPERLWLLVPVAALAVGYLVLQRRRRHYALRFTNLDLLASLAPRRPGWRRHAAAGLVAIALASLVISLARPVRQERVPKEEATVMLVLDTSASMEATDVAPTRLRAAIDAGTRFVEGLPERVRVGLVTFDRTTRVVASPTDDHEQVASALARLATGPGTAAGEALYAALEVIAASGASAPEEGDPAAAIVLLSDGVTTVGRPVEEAAAAAADQRVPVTTIAFGTDGGTVRVQGRTIPVPADPASMTAVAETTGGNFFEAFSPEQLRRVYDDIGSRVGYELEQREIASRFVATGVLLLLLGVTASLVWSARLL